MTAALLFLALGIVLGGLAVGAVTAGRYEDHREVVPLREALEAKTEALVDLQGRYESLRKDHGYTDGRPTR